MALIAQFFNLFLNYGGIFFKDPFSVSSVEWKTLLIPASNYMIKVNNRNTRARCEICSKLTIRTPERRHW